MQNYKSNSLNTEKPVIKCGNNTLNFSEPLIMGILNITPDSFFDGGRYTCERNILDRAGQIIDEGAHILDLGAYSTRPGAACVSQMVELKRMLPAVAAIRKEYPNVVLSVDTFRSQVARQVVETYGPCIINDISGGTMDEDMFSTIGELKVPYIMMHIKGTPENMQQKAVYHDLMGEIKTFFLERIDRLKSHGVNDVILDPGFGFAKTLEHNYEIMARLSEFEELDMPLLVGISRKSMIFKLLDSTPEQSLNGTTALNMVALSNGANILRVHDVREAVEAVKIYSALKKGLQ